MKSQSFFLLVFLALFFSLVSDGWGLEPDDLLEMVEDDKAYIHPTTHFNIYYIDNCDTYPVDCTDPALVVEFGDSLEEVRSGLLAFGFEECDGEYFVYIYDLSRHVAWGWAAGVHDLDPDVGAYICAKQLLSFDPELLASLESGSDSMARDVGAHEYFHLLQQHYMPNKEHPVHRKWIIEGQADAVNDKVFLDLDEAFFGAYHQSVWHYLQDPDNLLEAEYQASLFWGYFMEKYGALAVEPGRGMDALLAFWETARDLGEQSNGIEIFDATLDNLGYSTVTFVDVFRDFVVANYAKDLTGPGVPDKYLYIDETQPPGSYGSVYLRQDESPAVGHILSKEDYVASWQPRYYRYGRKHQTSTFMEVSVHQFTNDELFFSLLTVRDGDLVDETRITGRHFNKSLLELDPADDIVLIVAGLDNLPTTPAKYAYSISPGGSISVNLLSPPNSGKVPVGLINDPGKFLGIVEVLESASPVLGLTAEDFEVRVGTENANVVTAAYVDGLYFLVVQAPVQQSVKTSGENVFVTVAGEQIWANYGVLYYDEGDSWPLLDTVIVLDRSGSMSRGDKIEAAKSAAQLYVDSFLGGNRIGLVQYDDTVQLLQGLEDVSTARDQLLDLISQIDTGDRTTVGGGLSAAQDELNNNPGPDHTPHIFLLTDGRENEPPDLKDVFWNEIYNTDTQLDVVAIGDDAQVSDLEYYAEVTEGKIFFAFDPSSGTLTSDLGSIYRFVAEDILKEQRIVARQGQKSGSWHLSESVDIGRVEQATIAFNYRASKSLDQDTMVSLMVPGLGVMQPTFTCERKASASDEYYGHFVWHVYPPPVGEYKLDIEASGEIDIEYLFEASVRGGPVTLFTHVTGLSSVSDEGFESRKTGDQVPILAFLSDLAPILGAEVVASITAGTGYNQFQKWILRLYDDGAHGDGLSDDGVYGNYFTCTGGLESTENLPGVTYSVTISAGGRSNSGDSFKRESSSAFHLVRDPNDDEDSDGLPDNWESRHGIDLYLEGEDGGRDGDPDGDGLTNIEELIHGTSPTNSDTDRGGESDSSEVNNGRDPYDRNDDTVLPPLLRAIPGTEKVTLYFGARSSHKSLSLYRSQDAERGYQLIAENIEAKTHEYNDENLTNDQTYYYRMTATGESGQISGFSLMVSATPKVDPVRPWGVIKINGGAEYTDTTRVNLDLLAQPDVIEVRISNTPRFEDAPWRNFVESIPWTLSGGGLQHVFVQFRDSAGNIGGAPTDIFPHEPTDFATDSIVVIPPTAYDPYPADGSTSVSINTELSWTPGSDAMLHSVYFGDNFDIISNDTGAPMIETTTYNPGPLEPGKTYYWRVDEVDADGMIHTGDVWSFTTETAG